MKEYSRVPRKLKNKIKKLLLFNRQLTKRDLLIGLYYYKLRQYPIKWTLGNETEMQPIIT